MYVALIICSLFGVLFWISLGMLSNSLRVIRETVDRKLDQQTKPSAVVRAIAFLAYLGAAVVTVGPIVTIMYLAVTSR